MVRPTTRPYTTVVQARDDDQSYGGHGEKRIEVRDSAGVKLTTHGPGLS